MAHSLIRRGHIHALATEFSRSSFRYGVVAYIEGGHQIPLIHFSSPDEAEEWMEANAYDLLGSPYLMIGDNGEIRDSVNGGTS